MYCSTKEWRWVRKLQKFLFHYVEHGRDALTNLNNDRKGVSEVECGQKIKAYLRERSLFGIRALLEDSIQLEDWHRSRRADEADGPSSSLHGRQAHHR